MSGRPGDVVVMPGHVTLSDYKLVIFYHGEKPFFANISLCIVKRLDKHRLFNHAQNDTLSHEVTSQSEYMIPACMLPMIPFSSRGNRPCHFS